MKSYRPDIDGLRAIAVLSVLFYHCGLGCPGGYTGVDVFFVISGFLITSLILRDLREGKFSLISFWERRVRRIFPAAAVCVAVTCAAAWFLLLPSQFVLNAKAAIAQTAVSSNIFFKRSADYFDGGADHRPLLHTWSLSVEEQFYLFFPLLLVLLFRSARLRESWKLAAALAGLLAAGLAYAAVEVQRQPVAAFFLLPSRAWELLSGAVVASLPPGFIPVSRRVREAAAWTGLAAILAPVWLYSHATPFPGLAAIPPCLGTALIIWAGLPVPGERPVPQTAAAALLSIRPAVFIGLISYSLYLWHWPLFAYFSYWKTGPLPVLTQLGIASGSVLLAILSWRYVETPFRQKRWCASRRSIFLFAAGAAVPVAAFSALVILKAGFYDRIPGPARMVIEEADQDHALRNRFRQEELNITNPQPVADDALRRFGDVSKREPDFVILGDSHAEGIILLLDSMGKKHQLTGVAITCRGTAPLIGWSQVPGSVRDADQVWVAALDYIKQKQIRHVFVHAYWSAYQSAGGGENLERSLTSMVEKLKGAGARVWLLLDAPVFEANVNKAMARNALFPFLEPQMVVRTENDHRAQNSALYNFCSNAPAAECLDPAPQLFDPQTGECLTTFEGHPLYLDSNHLTMWGYQKAAGPLIESAFQRITETVSGR